MSTKFKNTKKKMASLGLRKDANGDYILIDPEDPTSEFVPVRKKSEKKSWYQLWLKTAMHVVFFVINCNMLQY